MGVSHCGGWIDKRRIHPQPAAMENAVRTLPPAKHAPVFAIACWLLGLMAFLQLLVAGMALAVRFRESQVVQTVIKEVPKYVAVRMPDAVVTRPPVAPVQPPPVASLPLPPANPIATPQVEDPRSERLVKEARQARVKGDLMLAIIKLEEANGQSPDDPSVLYELGLTHEQLGVNDTAAAYYEKVFQMGVTGAGSLYGLAASKLREGFIEPSALGKLSLGRVQSFKEPDTGNGEQVILTIPTQKAPGEEIDYQKVSVDLLFFNRTSKGEILPMDAQDSHREEWLKPPFDWADGEETLRVTYTVAAQDHQTEHLFGERSYYGQVVILRYNDQELDVQAWPRHLAAMINTPAANPNDSSQVQGSLPADFDPSLGVLPGLPPP